VAATRTSSIINSNLDSKRPQASAGLTWTSRVRFLCSAKTNFSHSFFVPLPCAHPVIPHPPPPLLAHSAVDNALSMLTNPDILNSLTSMVQQPLPQQPHAYNMPQQHHHSNGAYPPNPGPAGGTYGHRPNAPSYPPSHQMPGPGGLHDSRGQMFDGGSGQHAHRAMDAPPPHHMVQGIPPTGTGALVSRGSFPFDARGGQAPPQRPAAYPPPSRPDPRQPLLDDRTREYRGMEMGSYVGQAAPMQSSRAELEQLPHAMAHLQGGGRDMGAGAGGLDVMGRRAPMDYRQQSHDMNRGPHVEAYGGPGGAAQTGAFRGPAPAAFRSGDYERAHMPGNHNYREMPPNDFRGGVEARNRDESRLHRGGGSLLDAYSSEQPRYGGASAAAPPLSRNSLDGVRRGGESLLDQYGGGEMDLRSREVGRGGGGGGSNRWDNRRSPSPPYARPTREGKFGLPGRPAREPLPSAYSSKYDRRRSRSPVDRRVASREGVRRSPKDGRGANDEEVPPTKELFVGDCPSVASPSRLSFTWLCRQHSRRHH
jgi:hypothetical protein